MAFGRKANGVMKGSFSLFLLGLLASPVFSQTDSVRVLGKVVLQASKLENFSNTQHVQKIPDSVLVQSQTSLTQLLRFRSPLYFKENGFGGVSSVSFRGTTPSHTAVVWNGININSRFNGQTDFNSIHLGSFDEISVRSGGGSVAYGTGAIGGSVHLVNDFEFKKEINHRLKLGYGSFETFDGRYDFSVSSKETAVEVSVSRTSSDNDFEIPDSDRKNLNGQYHFTTVGADVAHRLDSTNTLKFHGRFSQGERHFSLVYPSETPTKYRNLDSWNLLGWESAFGGFSSNLKTAFLLERYEYFTDTSDENFAYYSEAKTFIAKYDLGKKFANGMEAHALLDYDFTDGKGTSVPTNTRQTGSVGLLLKQQLTPKLLYEIGLKKEFSDEYESPFLFSVGTVFGLAEFYDLKLNFSKNYRIPTFNDLYWYGSGNTDLKPETSLQGEIGNHFAFGNLDFSFTGYYNDIQNLIRWVPRANGLWEPVNTSEARSYGLESGLGYRKSFGAHAFSINATYAYTVSENKQTGNQLIYVPNHKTTTSLGYAYKKWSLGYNFLHTGEVFTRSDNDSAYKLPGYSVSNLMLSRSFGKNDFMEIGGKALNLFNEKYQSVENRYFPGFHVMVFIVLNIEH
jgi:iron complex outermembrane receptor protein